MRETVDVVVPEFPGTRNRDRGKQFRIREWPASKAESWGMRMLLAANKGAGELPLHMAGIGMEGIAILGINTFLRGTIDAETLLPLWDELLQCVVMVRDKKTPLVETPVTDNDIEEVPTRLWLRGEVLSLHLNFSVKEAYLALYRNIMAPARSSSTPSTSQPESPPLSPGALP